MANIEKMFKEASPAVQKWPPLLEKYGLPQSALPEPKVLNGLEIDPRRKTESLKVVLKAYTEL